MSQYIFIAKVPLKIGKTDKFRHYVISSCVILLADPDRMGMVEIKKKGLAGLRIAGGLSLSKLRTEELILVLLSFLPTWISHNMMEENRLQLWVPEQVSLPWCKPLAWADRVSFWGMTLEPRLLWTCNQEIWREMGLHFLAAVTSPAQNYQYPVVWQVQASLLPAVLLSTGSWVHGWALGQLLVFLSSDGGFLFPSCFMDALMLLRSCLTCSTRPCSPSTPPTLLVWEVLTEQSTVRLPGDACEQSGNLISLG